MQPPMDSPGTPTMSDVTQARRTPEQITLEEFNLDTTGMTPEQYVETWKAFALKLLARPRKPRRSVIIPYWPEPAHWSEAEQKRCRDLMSAAQQDIPTQ